MVDRILGIDPGLEGGLVVLDETGRLIASMAMPTYRVPKSDGGTRRMVCATRVAQFVRQHKVTKAIVEDVFSRKGEGHVGAFSFGEGKGVLRGVLAALDVPTAWVSPLVWKDRLGLCTKAVAGESKGARQKRVKAVAIAYAHRLFPRHTKELAKDGPAEAALLASYAILARL